MSKREFGWRIVLVLAHLLAVGLILCFSDGRPAVSPRPTPAPTALGVAALLLSPPPPPEAPPGMVGILRPTLVWPTPTPAPMATPVVSEVVQQSRNVVAVVTNKAGVDVYGQIENYADPDHVGGVILLAGRPAAHVAVGEYVLIVNLWGLLAEVMYGEGWTSQGWVSARELCTHFWCWPVK